MWIAKTSILFACQTAAGAATTICRAEAAEKVDTYLSF